MSNIQTVNGDNPTLVNAESDDYVLSYYVEQVANEKVLDKIIKKIEGLVRHSKQYKTFTDIIRENLNYDAYFKHLKAGEVSIDLHHYPFTLYDVVQIIIISKIIQKQRFSTCMIASEVLKLHFQNEIGLIPLSKTSHQLVHCGKLKIDYNMTFGMVDTFVKKYNKFMTNYQKNKYNDLLNNKEIEIDLSVFE